MAKQVVHECIQTDRFNVMSKQVADVKLDVSSLKEDLDEHRRNQIIEQEGQRKSMEENHSANVAALKAISKQMETMVLLKKTVDEKLIPVYNKNERNRIADEVIKERAIDWKFWMAFGSGCVAFASLVVWFIKQMFK